MHPNKVPREYRRKNEHINGAQHNASQSYPRKSGQCFENRMVQFYAAGAPQWQEPAQQTDDIYDFSAEYALPAVFFE